MPPSVDNIMAVYNRASDEALVSGLTWYERAHTFALCLDSNVERAAGVIAAISPNVGWKANRTLAIRAYRGDTALGWPDKNNKVMRILDGESPHSVLKGPKVTAFFNTILDPHGDSVPTIDRHAFDVANGIRLRSKRRDALYLKGAYEFYCSLYRDAANIVGIAPSQMQAITWSAWREIHGIRY